MQHPSAAPGAEHDRPPLAVPAMRSAPPAVDGALTVEAAARRITGLVLKATSLADRYDAVHGRRSPEAAQRIATLRSAAERGRAALLALV